MSDEYQEVTLADIVRVLFRRKLVIVGVFLVVLLGGVAYTVFQDPKYESTTTLVPLEHQDIIKNWLGSRHAAELVAADLGDPLLRELFPDRWSGGRRGEPPTSEQSGAAVERLTSVTESQTPRGPERFLSIRVRLHDPVMAREVADAYVRTLDVLRPHLENITRQALFDQYYDGQNEQEAQRRAEVTAMQQDYWLVLDSANTPREPVSPNVTLNVALSIVLGLLLAVFAAFFVEWLSRYRAEAKRVDAPPAPEAKETKPGKYT